MSPGDRSRAKPARRWDLEGLVVAHGGPWYAPADAVALPGGRPGPARLDVATVVAQVFGDGRDPADGAPRRGRRIWRRLLVSAARGRGPADRVASGGRTVAGPATLVAVQDVSGSLAAVRPVAGLFWRWLAAALEGRHGPMDKVLVVHRRRPEAVTAEAFFAAAPSGGTALAPTYAFVGERLAQIPAAGALYVVHLTDGRGWSPRDERQAALFAARWMHRVHVFACVEAGTDASPSPLVRHLLALGHPALRVARLDPAGPVADAIAAVLAPPEG
ncbi:MAG: DUF444 family protein [Actinomycetia bacterium]|nr:DUF444 family protein [Actinomycetes bacterium]